MLTNRIGLIKTLFTVAALLATIAAVSEPIYACDDCNSSGYCKACQLNTTVLMSPDTSSAVPIKKDNSDITNGTSTISVPMLSQDEPVYNDNSQEWEIIMRWGELKVCFVKSDATGTDPNGSYKSTRPDVHAAMQYYTSPPSGLSNYNVISNGYRIAWNDSEQLVSMKDPQDNEIFENVTYTDGQVTAYTQGDTVHTVGYDTSDRVVTFTAEMNSTATSKTYTKYTEENGVLVRKRATIETFNSDGSSRYSTTIHGYYGSSAVEKSGYLKFVVTPEGTRKFLAANGTIGGISFSDPKVACDLDNLATVTETALLEYASTIYEDYDSEGRVTLETHKGCGSCGSSGTRTRTTYLENSQYAGGVNEWKTCRRIIQLDATGNPLATAASIQYMNGDGQILYDIKQTVSQNGSVFSADAVWVTAHRYAVSTDYGDLVPRLVEIHYPSTKYTKGQGSSETIGTSTFEWTTVPTYTTPHEIGKVVLYEYHASSDITLDYSYGSVTYNGTAKYGDFRGKLKYTWIRQGIDDANAKCLQSKMNYVAVTVGSGSAASKKFYPHQTTYYDEYTVTDTGGVVTTNEYVFGRNGDNAMHRILEAVVVNPVVASAEHGPGGTSGTSRTSVYKHDALNNQSYVQWTKDSCGSLSFRELNSLGQLVKEIRDVNTSTGSGFSDLPQDWSNSNGLHLITEYTYDSYGRLLTVIDPNNRTSKFQHASSYDSSRDQGTTIYLVSLNSSFVDSSGNYDVLPVSITVSDMDGRRLISAEGKPTGSPSDGNLCNDWTASWGSTDSIEDKFAGILTARTDTVYDSHGRVSEARRYHDIPSDGAGALGTNYHRTSYRYDANTGLRTHAIQVKSGTTSSDSVELLTKTDYDQLGRSIRSWSGVSIASHNLDSGDPTLYRNSETYYDESTVGSGTSGVGDGQITSTKSFHGANDQDALRSESYYDYRGRLRGTATAGHDGTNWVKSGPFTVYDYDNRGAQIAQASYDSEPAWSTVTGNWYFAQGVQNDGTALDSTHVSHRRSLSRSYYDGKGQLWKSTVHNIDSTDGSDDGSMASKYWYDETGRTIKTAVPSPGSGLNGLFTKTKYDGAGRVTETYLCYDHSETDTDYAAAAGISNDTVIRVTVSVYDDGGRLLETKVGTTTANAVAVQKQWYDDAWTGAGVAKPYLTGTSSLKAADTAQYVTTKFEYDIAGRTSKTIQPAASGTGDGNYATYTYDDLGRTLVAETFAENGSTDIRSSKSETLYGTSGQSVVAIASRVYKVSATGTLSGAYMETTYDSDAYGRQRKVTQPSGAFQKTVYDDYGRLTGSYLCSEEGSNVDPLIITDDIVVEQAIPFYDVFGRTWMVKKFQRHDDATGAGALKHSSDSQPKARVTYVVQWWDDLGRKVLMADYGDNAGTDIAESDYATAGFDFDGDGTTEAYAAAQADMANGTLQYILARYQYDGYGRNDRTTDNRGIVTKTFFDDSGRPTHVVENYVPGQSFDPDSPGSRSSDVNRVTKMVYNEAGQVKQRIAIDVDHDVNTSDNQVTQYVYAVELSSSDFQVVKDGTALRSVIYPDSDNSVSSGTINDGTGYDRVEYTYYADGSTKTKKDQRGTEHTYLYDNLGRITRDGVTALGGADDFVMSITYEHEAIVVNESQEAELLRQLKVDSWSDADGTGTQRNSVWQKFSNGWGGISDHFQANKGDATWASPLLLYTYAEISMGGNAKNVRTAVECRPFTSVNYTYPTSGIGAALNRVSEIDDDTDTVIKYTKYLGAAAVVELEYPQVAVSGNPLVLSYGGSGTFSGFDQFGRVKEHAWKIKTAGTLMDGYGYGYDPGGNRLWRENLASSTRSELYHANGATNGYDGLARLTDFRRGTLSDANGSDGYAYDTVSTDLSRGQVFTLDQLGNWAKFKLDASGDDLYSGTVDLDQDRTHNKVNELKTFSEVSGQKAWVDPVHDSAGNMIKGPSPANGEMPHFYVYDAWNRMVAVYEDTTTDGSLTTSGGTVDKLLAEYRYNGLNHRIAKLKPTAYDGSNVPTTYTRWDYYYNPSWQVADETCNTGRTAANKESVATSLKASYIWDQRYIDAPVVRYFDANSDSDFNDDNEKLYYMQDANFNVTGLINTSGTVVERYVYDPYGAVTFYDDSWNLTHVSGHDVDGTASAFGNEILYCGYRYEPESGLYHVRNRMYVNGLGRWAQRDPIGYKGGVTFYEYVSQNPVKWCDPLGLAQVEVGVDISFGIWSKWWTRGTNPGETFDYEIIKWEKNKLIYKAYGETMEVDEELWFVPESFQDDLTVDGVDAEFRGGREGIYWKEKDKKPTTENLVWQGLRRKEHCVQCITWQRTWELEFVEDRRLATSLIDLGVALVPGGAVVKVVAVPFTLISKKVIEEGAIEKKRIAFSAKICADRTVAIGIYNVPKPKTTRFTYGNTGQTKHEKHDTWMTVFSGSGAYSSVPFQGQQIQARAADARPKRYYEFVFKDKPFPESVFGPER